MVFGTSWFYRVLYKIYLKIVQILIKKVPPVNSEVVVDLKNIESPEFSWFILEYHAKTVLKK